MEIGILRGFPDVSCMWERPAGGALTLLSLYRNVVRRIDMEDTKKNHTDCGCGCGHHHEEEHAGCGCGHYHEEEHTCACGCGHGEAEASLEAIQCPCMKQGAGSMMKYLPQADLEKLKTVLAIKNAYNAGKVSLADAQKELKAKVGTLKPYEIALAEQELKEVEDDECRKEDIQKMLELFDGILDTGRPDLPKDHPIMCYYREDDELRKILDAVEDLVQYPLIKNQWIELYDKLGQYRVHLSRKQNQLYPVLEKKGFDRPTTTMWLLDDFIRDEIKEARALLDADKDDEFLAMQKTVVDDVRDLMTKEETVLYPTSLAMISPDEFEHMKSGDKEIGFAWITADGEKSAARPAAPKAAPAGAPGFGAELAALLGKYGYGAGAGNLLDVTTGQLTLDQINLVYQHMPVDLSFVDENEKVCFYTDTKHRVFPRSKNVIGRDVKNCHPRTSVHIVEEIIEKFRSGEQDKAEFWINKPGLFIYILYVAVRDEAGHFKGVLEMMQDCTHIRSLEGSRTLLTWDKDNGESYGKEAPAEEAKDTAAPTEAPKGDLEITGDTFVKDILAAYPFMREKMAEINGKFKLLQTPLARVMLPKATVHMMSERSGMPLGQLIEAIKAKIGEGK